MGVRIRSWWQQTREHTVVKVVNVLFVVLVILLILIILGYIFGWSWIGVNGIVQIQTTQPYHKGTATLTQQQRTLWDWLQLLIIPVILAIGGYLFSFTTRRNERDIATDNQREAAFQSYIDKMSELLLEKHLRESQPEDEVRTIARVRTLTTLSRLDEARKRRVLQFLHESKLIDKGKSIVALNEADLSETDLSFANLYGADLSKTDLSGADLMFANLLEANLMEADLSGASLIGAGLIGASLIKADLNGSDLSGANLDGSDLSGANLSGSDLSETSLKGANLSRVGLIGADLSKSDLSGADLSESFMREANLSGAKLDNIKLDRANLDNANLKGVTGITNEELEKQAKSLKGATMIDGKIHQ
jgi:uncharacterized protein YjbI with pentapeptide repeats